MTSELSPDIALRFSGALDRLRHRGPHDEGVVALRPDSVPEVCGGPDCKLPLAPFAPERSTGGAALLLGHRRLSILDLTPAGHQPMCAADGKVWITYNGEIYNYRELREQLVDTFHFRTGSDTEVLLAAWLAWGPAMLSRLTGMFAFAIADLRDTAAPRLFLARDPFGIKPLYIAEVPGGIAFASEPKALLAMGAPRAANPRRLYTFLSTGITDYGTETFFNSIHQLPAGGWAEWQPFSQRAQNSGRYWEPKEEPAPKISVDEAAAELRTRFENNVRLHLRSDVPVGSALSGGIDSSSIVCLMRRLEPAAEIHAFSYLSEDPAQSEAMWMETVAAHARVQSHRIQPGTEAFAAALPEMVRLQDEPFGTTAVFAQHQVFQLAAAAGIRVMLDGQGADEIFGGYAGFDSFHLAGLLRRRRLIKAGRFLRSAHLCSSGSRQALLRGAVGALLSRCAPGTRREGPQQAILDRAWFATRGVSRHDLPPRDTGRCVLAAALRHSITVNSLPMLLRYEDRNSMAHSVESRVPFLTAELVSWAVSLPQQLFMPASGQSKFILRKAMRGVVPDTILDRRDKLGFTTPESPWLRSAPAAPWCRAALDAACALPALHPLLLQQQWAAFHTGSGSSPAPWRALSAGAWAQENSVVFS